MTCKNHMKSLNLRNLVEQSNLTVNESTSISDSGHSQHLSCRTLDKKPFCVPHWSWLVQWSMKPSEGMKSGAAVCEVLLMTGKNKNTISLSALRFCLIYIDWPNHPSHYPHILFLLHLHLPHLLHFVLILLLFTLFK